MDLIHQIFREIYQIRFSIGPEIRNLGGIKFIKKTVDKDAFKDNENWKCPFSPELWEEKSSLNEIICNGCGTVFKSDENSNYCSKCNEIFYDEP